jgi:hypothetical protein
MLGGTAFEIFINALQFHPIPNKKELIDNDLGKPKIEAHIVCLNVRTPPSVEIDGAMGSLGFHTSQELYLRRGEL